MSRRLKARKRIKRAVTGKAVRLSNEVLTYIDKRRQGIRSYDAFLRKQFGLPAWDGTPQPLVEGMLETTSGAFFLKTADWDSVEAEANGHAVLEAARRKTKKVNKPLRMREIA